MITENDKEAVLSIWVEVALAIICDEESYHENRYS